jgi:hypothetical protein
MASNLFKWPPHLGLRHFGNFEKQQIHQEVFEQKTYSTAQLFTSVLAKSRVYLLLAWCNFLVWLLKTERYWAFLKRNVKKRSTAAFYINLFKRKVNRTIKTIDRNVVQTLIRSLMRKVRQFGRGDKIRQNPLLVLNYNWISFILPKNSIK